MNLRGQLFAVADLASVVEGPTLTCAPESSDVVVVTNGGKTMALLVDEVRDVQAVVMESAGHEESAGLGHSGFLIGVGHFGETVVFHLDVPAVIRQTLA
jgi:chemotaxis signal transduction protein